MLRKEQGLDHRGKEFDKQGSCRLQESSKMDLPTIYHHRQTVEMRHRLRQLSSFFTEKQESVLRSEHNLVTIPRQFKSEEVASSSSNADLTCVDLSLKLPWLSAERCSSADTNHKSNSESFVNGKWRSKSQPTISDQTSRSLKDHRWHENIREDADSCKFTAKRSCPNRSMVKVSAHVLAKFPEASNRTSFQETDEVQIHSDLQNGQIAQGGGNTVSPPCLDSCKCSNFGAKITKAIARNTSNLRNGRLCDRSEEIHAMTEIEGPDKSGQQGIMLRQEDNIAKTPTKVEEDCFGLYLLLSAIQATSGGTFEGEDNVSEPSGMTEKVIETSHDLPFDSQEAYFIHGGAPIKKKRGIRQARNALMKQHGVKSLQNVGILELLPQFPIGRRKRKRPSHEKAEAKKTEHYSCLPVSDVVQMKNGSSAIRSKQGRSRVLPIKFSDSVLQPWKRR